MSIKSRRKGMKNENALVRFLQSRGFAAEKTSRTGYTGADLSVPLLGVDHAVECKVRANGFQKLYTWLENADLLIIRADRSKPLVVTPLELAAEIAAAAEKSR
jgi:Holliday junction resolvase